MIFIGLLTHEQKQLGYFVSQDEDFIYLFHRKNGSPRMAGFFLYDNATVKEIREHADKDIRLNIVTTRKQPSDNVKLIRPKFRSPGKSLKGRTR